MQQILWETDTDRLTPGQWFNGKIDHCDLSPSGGLLIYFALNGVAGTPVTASWTAISKPPWFTALALWPEKGMTYGGGGVFASDDEVYLRTRCEPLAGMAPPDWLSVRYWPGPEVRRDGWVNVSAPGAPPISEKALPGRGLRLRRGHEGPQAEGEAGQAGTRYRLIDELRGETVPLMAEWADFDHRGRLVVVREGTLVELDTRVQLGDPLAIIGDFNDARPKRRTSPAWARRW